MRHIHLVVLTQSCRVAAGPFQLVTCRMPHRWSLVSQQSHGEWSGRQECHVACFAKGGKTLLSSHKGSIHEAYVVQRVVRIGERLIPDRGGRVWKFFQAALQNLMLNAQRVPCHSERFAPSVFVATFQQGRNGFLEQQIQVGGEFWIVKLHHVDIAPLGFLLLLQPLQRRAHRGNGPFVGKIKLLRWFEFVAPNFGVDNQGVARQWLWLL
mmetsp:Transcript_27957/g.64979  ORF Transcript_27957/g.64979 Transcript_27957/m.64979 type:complete len:210 (-) Transcript_27957:45-674(-)